MSKKREFPILNGKLISDLDANGHKIIGADIEVPAEKIKEAVAPELEAKADKTELEAETQRATGVEATLGNAITAEAQRAQEAEAVLRGTVDGKVDKVASATAGNLAALDANGNLADSGNAVAGVFIAGSFLGGGSGGVGFQLGSTSEWVELYVNDGGGKILKFPLREGTLAMQDDIAPTFDETDAYDEGALVFHDGLYRCVNANGHTGAWVAADFAEATVEDVLAALRTALAGKQDALSQEQAEAVNSGITADKVSKLEGIEAGAQKNPDLSGYATKDAALPRYYFTILEVVDGVLTVPPYTSAYILGSYATAFTIAVGEGNSMYLRDCILCVQCGDVAPTITWPANFHPRTDAETDFACVAGAMNVYWISEYAQGEFAVAGWQATAGGSAV